MRSAEATAEPTVDPECAENPAQYVALLRRVRDESGLTYRMIQRRAEAAGSVLPPSTLATMLSRQTLPREDLVTALLTACGLGPDEVNGWLRARRRIRARGNYLQPVPPSGGTAGPDPTAPAARAAARTATTGTAPTPDAAASSVGGRPPLRTRLLLGATALFGGIAGGLTVVLWNRPPRVRPDAPGGPRPDRPGRRAGRR